LIPEHFYDVCNLLKFATQMADEGGHDDLEIGMLKNVRSGLSEVWQTFAVERRLEKEAERAEGAAEAHRNLRSMVETVDKIAERTRRMENAP
jgi:hypothetical protein